MRDLVENKGRTNQDCKLPNFWLNRLTQVGIGHFFQKPTNASTASFALVNAGYRYQSRKAFNVSVALGAQFWSERMRLRLGEDRLAETFNNLLPSGSAAHRLPGLDALPPRPRIPGTLH
ncbi:MAG: hypothetical protein LH606_21840 [Cytophagaceae bacterium]|nr:hypothetical protein [Cytophagaceae bacterium]